jgi:hypothetical protein
MTDLTYVTQEEWDQAQIALRAALDYVKARTPTFSTAGTDIDMQKLIAAAIRPLNAHSACEPR